MTPSGDDLARRHFGLAVRMARARLPRFGADPEQVGLDALFDAIRTFDPARGANFEGWLAWRVKHWVARHFASRRARKRAGVTRSLGLGDDPEIAADPEAVDIADRSPPPGAALEAAELLDLLSPSESVPIRLVYLDGLTIAEAAGRLGLKPAATHRRIERGLARLRDRLASRGIDR